VKKTNITLLTACALQLICNLFAAQAQETSVESIHVQQAKQLATLKSQLTELKQRWNDDRSTMQRRIAALEERRENLNKTNEDLRANIAKMQKRKQLLNAEKNILEEKTQKLTDAATTALNETLDTLETSFSAYVKVNALPESALVKTEITDLNQCIDKYAEVILDAVRFANSLHSCSIILDAPDGKSRQMNVLLVGANLAFATAPDESLAAYAFRQEDSWEWQWHSAKVARAIAQALKITKNQASPAIINLPMPARPQ
jgi:predicted RNase H-like nuclease (RuvC/YqgF family)